MGGWGMMRTRYLVIVKCLLHHICSWFFHHQWVGGRAAGEREGGRASGRVAGWVTGWVGGWVCMSDVWACEL